jgi:hypothetical protein
LTFFDEIAWTDVELQNTAHWTFTVGDKSASKNRGEALCFWVGEVAARRG